MSQYKAFLIITLPIYALFIMPIFFFEFGFSDDYFGVWKAQFSENWTSSAIEQGRPIQGWINSLLFDWAGSVKGLSKLRAVGGLLALTFAFLMYNTLVRINSFTPKLAAWAILPLLFTPSIYLLIAWPCTMPALVSLILAYSAGLALQKPLTGSWIEIIVAIPLLALSLLTYQAATAACFIPYLIAQGSRESKVDFHLFWRTFVLFIGVNLCYYSAFTWYQTTMDLYVGRAELTTNFGARIGWFVTAVLPKSASLFMVTTGGTIRQLFSLAFGVVMFTGLFTLWRRSKLAVPSKTLQLAICIFTLFVSYYMNLAAKEEFFSFRTTTALTTVLYVIGLFALENVQRIQIKQRMLMGITAVAVCFGGLGLYGGFVIPQSSEFDQLKMRLKSETALNLTYLLADAKRYHQFGWMPKSGDELGVPSTSIPWAIESMIWLADQSNGYQPLQRELIQREGVDSCLAGCLDLNEITFGQLHYKNAH